MEAAADARTPLRALESVCCLECGEIYSKPVAGGTVHKNPGCPQCGYVGWIPLSLPSEPLVHVAGRRRRRFATAR
jgi:hypothetical protein